MDFRCCEQAFNPYAYGWATEIGLDAAGKVFNRKLPALGRYSNEEVRPAHSFG